MKAEAKLGRPRVSAFVIPTDAPEADGTLAWDRTTLVVVEVAAGEQRGIGYTYADTATARLLMDVLAPVVEGHDAFAIPGTWEAMRHRLRNLGRPGICSMALSAMDVALWDLKAKLLGLSVVELLGQVRSAVPVYGSGGFTSYSVERLQAQLLGWKELGIRRVKMKVGENPGCDLERVQAAKDVIGECQLFVDANGAYSRKEALGIAGQFAAAGVKWFEEPVSSDDLEGLRLLRDRAPAGVEVAAGEYGYDLPYFERMLAAQAVDVLQVDATRCGGYSEFLKVGALCAARSLPLSSHTAPTLHAHVCCALSPVVHAEYFHDHVRIEGMLFDGALVAVRGELRPDKTRPGLGIELKRKDAERFAI